MPLHTYKKIIWVTSSEQLCQIVNKIRRRVLWPISHFGWVTLYSTPFIALSVAYKFWEEEPQLARCLVVSKVSHLLIVNTLLFFIRSNFFFFQSEHVYALRHLVQHIGILEMTILRFSMQVEDIMEHIVGKCHVYM